jgi:predicted aldo/keto reductase-like oxidoreductase
MQYRVNQKNGDKLSVLGYGCMRYTRTGGSIDQEKAEKEMKLAVDAGVNYFDTAYIYNGCEECLGKFMEKYDCRSKINVATKLPQYYIKKIEDVDRYFAEQLRRLKTDYVDYYLLHMLNDAASFKRLCELGIREWIADKKAKGIIRNIGFSFHGSSIKFIELIDAYDWDFAQVQFNYLDEHSQAGIEGIKHANEKDIPIIIMEPLRGGRLVNNLPAKAMEAFDKADVKRSPADWGLRWVWNHPEVNVVLSGMNDIAQVEENVRIASEATAGSLTESDMAMYKTVLDAINESVKVGCTGCGYCQPCPQGVDIPGCFAAYNHSFTDKYFVALKEYMMCTTMRKNRTNAGRCIECGKCEQHCPQGIKIREELKKVQKRMETPIYKIAAWGVKILFKY